MAEPTHAQVQARLAESFALDRQWRLTMGLPESDTKAPALKFVSDLLERERVPYALIGGLAVQLHSEEPRTTADIDVALKTFNDVPQAQLVAAGFEHVGRFAHSDNWLAPGPGSAEARTPVQFSADDLTPDAVDRAQLVVLRDLRLRLVSTGDLLALKLRAAENASRRPSKRASDVADILRLVEDHPDLRGNIPDFTLRLARLQRAILGVDRGR